MLEIEAHELYNLEDKVLVDVRSPSEYNEFHIPGAINLPIFEDEEKKIIGFIYRTQGTQKAKDFGYSIAQSKLARIFDSFRKLKDNHRYVIVYCWRGGMRSQELCKALSSAGIQVIRLKGGYRAYRQFILQDIQNRLRGVNFLVLTGKTGVGKSKILRLLKMEGLPVIDLEDLAQDRGSVFGKVGKKTKVSQKMFDALLYESLRGINCDYAFIEDESRCVGNIHLPDVLWSKKEEGVFIELENSMENRVKNILEEYTKVEGWEEEVRQSLERIKKYLGESDYTEALNMLKNKKYETLVKFLIETHYDRRYRVSKKPIYTINCSDIQRCKAELIKIFDTYSKICPSSFPR
ncbi:MAG: tRNA 2-selenouridine(34) synthase MnmH [Hydrogenobacter sp.]|uniref:tRNA 2-selenouridine(34) synthase MnmH n=1 Tax=Hydrogenobacter thermophilus TaxID=940 RepID=UPI0030FA5555